jgi:hypothetical protein
VGKSAFSETSHYSWIDSNSIPLKEATWRGYIFSTYQTLLVADKALYTLSLSKCLKWHLDPRHPWAQSHFLCFHHSGRSAGVVKVLANFWNFSLKRTGLAPGHVHHTPERQEPTSFQKKLWLCKEKNMLPAKSEHEIIRVHSIIQN